MTPPFRANLVDPWGFSHIFVLTYDDFRWFYCEAPCFWVTFFSKNFQNEARCGIFNKSDIRLQFLMATCWSWYFTRMTMLADWRIKVAQTFHLRPSHTTTETTKNSLRSIHTTTFFTTATIFQQFYIWATIFTPIFLEKSLWKSL